MAVGNICVSNFARLEKPIDASRKKNANGTRRTSQAVPHPSTDRALRRLTSEFGWDRVYSTQYGRWQKYMCPFATESEVSACAGLFFLCKTQIFKKASSTRRASQAVPHPSTDPGLMTLNYRVQMGSGVFDIVWSLATALFSSECRLTEEKYT